MTMDNSLMDNTSELDKSTQGETQLSSTQPPSTSASLAEKSTVPTVKRKAASRLQMKNKLRGDENLITEATNALKVIYSGQSTHSAKMTKMMCMECMSPTR